MSATKRIQAQFQLGYGFGPKGTPSLSQTHQASEYQYHYIGEVLIQEPDNV
jgi:hypothetical protein